ncbi:MAG: CpaF family protein [Candidatus Eiseniibacteriota bacterium]
MKTAEANFLASSRFGRARVGAAKAACTPAAHQAAPSATVEVLLPQATPARAAEAGHSAEIRPFGRTPLPAAAKAEPAPAKTAARSLVLETKDHILDKVFEALDMSKAALLPRTELTPHIDEVVGDILAALKRNLNHEERRALVQLVVDEMVGLGPLEPLLADDTVTDIMVNGAKTVFVERAGKIERTGVVFRDDKHVYNTAVRIATRVGRRIDETNPLVDARLEDGSRVNIIIPPLAIDGPSISIRKFSRRKFNLVTMARQGNMAPAMAALLAVAGRSRLNILISGGTGSGKTTLLNAISETIDPAERIVTVEDAAELQLQKPHVVRLETRPASIEGKGEIKMRDLVKNALRMRPDRIILGEVRGSEAVDMLQAMNTGHDGSLGTIHANSPREALTRLEHLIAMAGLNLPTKAVRMQVAAALDMIVQVERMRDGTRRITRITEIVGIEGDTILTQDLFVFRVTGEGPEGEVVGDYEYSGLPPHFLPKARYYGLEQVLLRALHGLPGPKHG